jgi:type IV pilus assembly protein PilV
VRLNVRGRGPARQRGVSLIEVLVSTVVVSVGALSATSLQLVSKRNNRDATQRLEATHLASSLAERMRANNSSTGLQAYVSNAAAGVGLARIDARLKDSFVAHPLLMCSTSSYACTPAELAAAELWQWEQVMDGCMEQVGVSGNCREAQAVTAGNRAAGLDQATACISAPPTVGAGREGFYTVTIAFRGTVAMPDDESVSCGRNAAYSDGTPLYGAHNEYRRVLTLAAYITPTVAK